MRAGESDPLDAPEQLRRQPGRQCGGQRAGHLVKEQVDIFCGQLTLFQRHTKTRQLDAETGKRNIAAVCGALQMQDKGTERNFTGKIFYGRVGREKRGGMRERLGKIKPQRAKGEINRPLGNGRTVDRSAPRGGDQPRNGKSAARKINPLSDMIGGNLLVQLQIKRTNPLCFQRTAARSQPGPVKRQCGVEIALCINRGMQPEINSSGNIRGAGREKRVSDRQQPLQVQLQTRGKTVSLNESTGQSQACARCRRINGKECRGETNPPLFGHEVAHHRIEANFPHLAAIDRYPAIHLGRDRHGCKRRHDKPKHKILQTQLFNRRRGSIDNVQRCNLDRNAQIHRQRKVERLNLLNRFSQQSQRIFG